MKFLINIGFLVLGLSYFTEFAYAYGSSGGKTCEKPLFSKFQPAPDAVVPTFSEFSFSASPNTSPASLAVTINAGSIKYTFNSKDLQISQSKTGAWQVAGRLAKPLREGFARLNVSAKSNLGCPATDGYLIKLAEGKAR